MEFRYTSMLTHDYTFNKRMSDLLGDLRFHTKDFRVIWYNDSIMGSKQQEIQHCDAIKQTGDTVTAG